MGLLMPRPSDVICRFEMLKNKKGIRAATQYFTTFAENPATYA